MSSGALAGYCIRATGEVPPSPELTGIGGAPVRCVEAAGLAIWLSDEVAGPATVDRMRAHDAVVRAAMRSATPTAVRSPTENSLMSKFPHRSTTTRRAPARP